MIDDDLIAIDLTDDERKMLVHGLNEYFGPAHGQPLLTPLVGLSNTDEFYQLVRRLREAVYDGEPLSHLDWARALVLTEICWASDILGAGADFVTNTSDERAAPLLRSIQYQVSNYPHLTLLLENAKLPATDR